MQGWSCMSYVLNQKLITTTRSHFHFVSVLFTLRQTVILLSLFCFGSIHESCYDMRPVSAAGEWKLGETWPDFEKMLHKRVDKLFNCKYEERLWNPPSTCKHLLFSTLKHLQPTWTSNTLLYIQTVSKVRFRHSKHVLCQVSLFTFQITDKHLTLHEISIIIWAQIALWSYKRGLQFQLINLKLRTSFWVLNNHNPWLIQNLRSKDW